MPPTHLTIAAVAERLRGSATSAREVAGELLAGIERHKELSAFTAVAADVSGPAADGRPLAGVLYAVKDNIDTVDLPTTAATPALRGSVAAANAPVVERLRRAGAVVVGKTNMHELALGTTSHNMAYGAVRNPHATDRTAGGSSGGSAAAVAAGLVPFALGTDTGGSVRIPASYCGIVGFRPSTGSWGNEGTVPVSPTRDTIGVLAHTVADAALVDSAVTGRDRAAAVSLAGLRLGVPRDGFYAGLHPDVSARTEAALGVLSDAGVELVELRVAGAHELDALCGLLIALFEMARALPAYVKALPAPFCDLGLPDIAAQISSPDVKQLVDGILDRPVPEAHYHECLATRERLQAAYAEAFARHRVAALVYPTGPLVAPPLNDTETTTHNGRQVNVFLTSIQNTGPGSVAGVPSLSLPNGYTPAGLPVGLSLEAASGADGTLLAVARAIEAAMR